MPWPVLVTLAAAGAQTAGGGSFLPVVLAVLAVITAIVTAVGGWYGLAAVRHRGTTQEEVVKNLIKSLADAEVRENDLRDRVSSQKAHIEIQDAMAQTQDRLIREQGERIHYLERQAEQWQSKLQEMERAVWSGQSPPAQQPPHLDDTSPSQ
jgi:uncharacterized protein HemX